MVLQVYGQVVKTQ